MKIVTHPVRWLLIMLAFSHAGIAFWTASACGVKWAMWPGAAMNLAVAIWGSFFRDRPSSAFPRSEK